MLGDCGVERFGSGSVLGDDGARIVAALERTQRRRHIARLWLEPLVGGLEDVDAGGDDAEGDRLVDRHVERVGGTVRRSEQGTDLPGSGIGARRCGTRNQHEDRHTASEDGSARSSAGHGDGPYGVDEQDAMRFIEMQHG